MQSMKIKRVKEETKNFHAQLEDEMAKRYGYLVKLLLIGDSGVGKTCVMHRLTTDTFDTNYVSTIGVDFKIRTIELDGKKIKLQIWDVSSQRFHTTMAEYYREAKGVMLVYDVTNVKSFVNIINWMRNVKENAPKDVEKILLGNKCDLNDNRLVLKSQGEALAFEHGVKFVEISAKSGINVEEAVFDLVRNIKAKMEKRPEISDASKAVEPKTKPPSWSCCII